MADHRIDYNEEKFAELLLLLAQKAANDPGFGAVKLHKLVFYSEFRAYRDLGHPISGVPLQNLEHGPAARRLIPVQDDLLEAGFAEIEREPTPVGVRKKLVAKRGADQSMFSDDELRIIDEVVKDLWGKSATQVSLESHEEPGWLVTSEREPIPYNMALLTRPEPTEEDERFVRELIENGAVPSRRGT